MNKFNILLTYLGVFVGNLTFSQSIEIDGQLRINNLSTNDTSKKVLALGKVNYVEWRTIERGPISGILIDKDSNNISLIHNGYSNRGFFQPELYEENLNTVKQGTWLPISDQNAPENISAYSSIWTGTDMIIWGGWGYSSGLNTGGKYNLSTNTWSPISSVNAPSFRTDHTAVWTGSKMIIWGGISSDPTGGIYDPSNDSWSTISNNNAPSTRYLHRSVWTGQEMIVWGGQLNSSVYYNDGYKYNPSTDTWTQISSINAPSPRSQHVCFWTGSEMIVFGGYKYESTNYIYFSDGARYNPTTDTWTPISQVNAPKGILAASAWTGSDFLFWAGKTENINKGGAKYNLSSDTWTPMSEINAPDEAFNQSFAWTGSELIVWGGSFYLGSIPKGGKYNPITNTWEVISDYDAPTPRTFYGSCWTGQELLLWGGAVYGINSISVFKGGFKYNPNNSGFRNLKNQRYYLYKKN